MTGFVFRKCCTGPDRPPVSDRAGFLHRVEHSDPMAGAAVKPADTADMKPDWSVCLHEAGHAVFAWNSGFEVGEVVAGRAGFVQTVIDGASWQDVVRFYLAGDLAGQLADTDDPRPSRENYFKWLPHIRNLGGGGCDECTSLRTIFVNNRDATDHALVSIFWNLENQVIQTLKKHEVRAALLALAHQLMNSGRLSAARTNEILKQHLKGKIDA